MSSSQEDFSRQVPAADRPKEDQLIAGVHQLADRVALEVVHDDPGDDVLRRVQDEQVLREALHWRTIIGQAMGLIMKDRGVTGEAAFAHLVEVSSHTNVKLRVVAARLVAEAESDLMVVEDLDGLT